MSFSKLAVVPVLLTGSGLLAALSLGGPPEPAAVVAPPAPVVVEEPRVVAVYTLHELDGGSAESVLKRVYEAEAEGGPRALRVDGFGHTLVVRAAPRIQAEVSSLLGQLDRAEVAAELR